MNKTKIIFRFLIVTISCLLIACKNNSVGIVDYQVLVVPETFKGVVAIFYGQKQNLGRCEFKDGKHYFYVDTSGIFFTKAKMGEGRIESLKSNSNESISVSSMSVNEETNEERFVVVGGAYRGFRTTLYKEGKEFVNFTVYKAGEVRTLKNGGWYVADSLVENLYEKFLAKKVN